MTSSPKTSPQRANGMFEVMSFPSPDLHARNRVQDSNPQADRVLDKTVRQPRAPGLIRGPCTGQSPLGNLNSRRAPVSTREREARADPLPLRNRIAKRSHITGLLRQEPKQMQEPHKQALLALARRRCDVLYAMLRDNRPYDANCAARLDKPRGTSPDVTTRRNV